jgi:hypothetical protein
LSFVARAMGALVAMGLRLRLGGLAGARRSNDRVAIASRPWRLDAERMARLVHLAASQGPYRPACLVRALTLQRLMRRSGFDGRLRIGVAKGAAGLSAHSWIEHEGRRLLDADGQSAQYAEFEPLPGERT